MATGLFFVLMNMKDITMSTVTGWEGLLLALGYIFMFMWDFSAIDRWV